MKTNRFVIFVFGLLLWSMPVQGKINRPFQPIVITGDTLSPFLSHEIEQLSLYRFDSQSNSWEIIPFQFDEVNPAVHDSIKYFVPEDTLKGLLDVDDELVFMAGDLGDKAALTSWPGGADSLRIEIAFTDSLDHETGYVYLYHLTQPPVPIPDTYAMAYDSVFDRISSANYQVGFNNTGQLSDVMIKTLNTGLGVDIFDRIKIRAIGSFWIFPIFLYEDNIEQKYAYAKQGPVRIIRNMVGSFIYDLLNLDERFTQTSFFYPYNGSFQLVELPIGQAKDVGAHVDVLRVSWDFNRNARGMKFYDEMNTAGALIDGKEDTLNTTLIPDDLNWTMGTGDQGTMLNVFYVPPLGDNIKLYYHEDSENGSTGDPGIAIDTGDDSSFADNGFLLEGNIENYITEKATFSFLYYNFFLPENFNPQQASIVCDQMRSPLGFSTHAQLYTPPTTVENSYLMKPDQFILVQNYPNPFNSSTKISFVLASSANVSLKIYDSLGRLVNTLVERSLPEGNHDVVWNGKDDQNISLASGLYFYRLVTNEFAATRKLMLIK